MAKLSADAVPMMLTLVCMGMLILQTTLANLDQFVPDLQKCWSSLTRIPSCLVEIYGSFSFGQIRKIGLACCTAIYQISDSCWSNMFRYNTFFSAELLKKFCAAPPPQAAAVGGKNNAGSKVVSLPPLFPPAFNEAEVRKCWKSITDTEGCALEVYKSFTSGQTVGIGPVCCKAVIEINDRCWPKMFPFNPFFPPLLKNTCAKLNGADQTPTAF
ncbi:ECA1 gametogenesis related family protein [Melia azedarach]|uniref:ECA1 gametogenesis related family protein n=1 Tax=Melia azedarach TaxID=155640 RepID=A0ACC1XC65_MELAZ|nr:ECA1 gametogenesis related family protein [Melia azedarach]